ncbi:MAG: glycosyltransferase [Chitinophagales bacterium]
MLKKWAKGKAGNTIRYHKDELPEIAIVIAAYNEEKVIAQKLQSILESDYPLDKMTVFIGSDDSTDKTNEICEKFAKENAAINFHLIKGRHGKLGVLNQLFTQYIDLKKYEVIIQTDANILFAKRMVSTLVAHFKNKEIGLVCANVKNKNIRQEGISKQESIYISGENQLKINEGKAFGASMGAFGACYAIRSSYIEEIPSHCLAEDFYFSMLVLQQNAKIITDKDAICYEDLPSSILEEFNRKKRISVGNFQNLKEFKSLLFAKNKQVSFAFFSHKVLRWLGPFFLLFAYVSLAILVSFPLYTTLFAIANLLLFLAFLDWALIRVDIHVNLLRLLRYFFMMNIALFFGFIKYVKGTENNVWTPTERNNG